MAASLHGVDVEMTGQDSNHGHSTEWASRADWIQHKKAISQLYAQNTLPEVMRIMESQYNFKATAKMYKTRIKRWGLDKKHKEKEMRAIVHKRAHRADKGKASVFWIRGKEVDYKDVVRYWERRHISMAEVLRQRAESSTPEPVECRTPVLPPLSTPAVLAIPEGTLLKVREYHKGSFESGIWRTNEDGFCCRTTKLESFSDDINWLDVAEDKCERACDAFDNRNSHEADHFLSVATDTIMGMVLAEHPYTFAQLFAFVQCIRWKGRPEKVSAILRNLSGMSELVLGRNHPFRMVCGWLAAPIMEDNSNAYQDIICESLRMVHDCFRRALGRLHHTTVEIYLIYLIQAHDRGSDVVAIELERLLRECELHFDPEDIRTTAISVRIDHHNGFLRKSYGDGFGSCAFHPLAPFGRWMWMSDDELKRFPRDFCPVHGRLPTE